MFFPNCRTILRNRETELRIVRSKVNLRQNECLPILEIKNREAFRTKESTESLKLEQVEGYVEVERLVGGQLILLVHRAHPGIVAADTHLSGEHAQEHVLRSG